MGKDEIREKILEKRSKLEKSKIIEKGNLVKEKLFSLEEYKKAKTVMFFVSFRKEAYTQDMIKEALKDKIVVVPKVKKFELIPCRIKDFLELATGYSGVLEPVRIDEVDLNDIDIVLVPGIAFDKRGYRIGYGKGYYDNFLKNVRALKIGLCMDFQIVDNIPEKEWDVKMDVVVSEDRVIRG